jgi:hypothetical protein
VWSCRREAIGKKMENIEHEGARKNTKFCRNKSVKQYKENESKEKIIRR